MQSINPIISEPDPKTRISHRDPLSSTSSNSSYLDPQLVLINGKVYSLVLSNYTGKEHDVMEEE